MSDDNKLIEIDVSEWVELRDMYKKDWPQHFVGYYTVDNFIRWKAIEPTIKNLHVYSLNGDWKSDGLFLFVDRYQLFINDLIDPNKSHERAETALSLLDWSNGIKVSTLVSKLRPSVLRAVEPKNLEWEFDSETCLMYMSKEDGSQLEFTLPPKCYLRTLSQDDAVQCDSVWPNRHQASVFFMKRIARWNPCVGLYNTDGKLMSWCLRLQAGALGAMQTDENHLRNGYGEIVLKAITKKLASIGHDTFACVNEDNSPSRRMFEKVGFKSVGYAHWMRTYALDRSFRWHDDENE